MKVRWIQGQAEVCKCHTSRVPSHGFASHTVWLLYIKRHSYSLEQFSVEWGCAGGKKQLFFRFLKSLSYDHSALNKQLPTADNRELSVFFSAIHSRADVGEMLLQTEKALRVRCCWLVILILESSFCAIQMYLANTSCLWPFGSCMKPHWKEVDALTP